MNPPTDNSSISIMTPRFREAADLTVTCVTLGMHASSLLRSVPRHGVELEEMSRIFRANAAHTLTVQSGDRFLGSPPGKRTYAPAD